MQFSVHARQLAWRALLFVFQYHAPFFFRAPQAGTYSVSPAASALLGVINDALSRACAASDTSQAEALIGAIGGVCALLRTLPHVAAPQLLQLPRASVLHHNDLCHVAEQLLLAPVVHGHALRAAAGGDVNFWQEAILLRWLILL